MRAIIRGQIVEVQILKEKKFLWWTFVLVEYTANMYNDGNLLYTEQRAKWINKFNLI